MLTSTAPALWCVKHRGRIVALVTGGSREAAGENAAPLIGAHDPDDLRISEVGIAKPGAPVVVMDLRAVKPQPTPKRTAEDRAAMLAERRANKEAKDAPFIDASASAWSAACTAVGCAKHRGARTFLSTDRSPLAAAARHGFWRAAHTHGVPATASAKATGSNPSAVCQRLRDGLSWQQGGPDSTAAVAEAAASKVFAALLPRTC